MTRLTRGDAVTVVEVNECRVFATTSGADWWTAFRSRRPGIADVRVSVGGNLVHVECESPEDAHMLLDTMVANGLPASALRVTRAVRRHA